MNRSRLAEVALLTLVSLPSLAAAQRCLGTASFASGMARVGGAVSFVEVGKIFETGVAMGRDNGAFASARYLRMTGDESDGTMDGVAGSVGYQIPAAGAAQFCPMVNISRLSSSVAVSGSSAEVSATGYGFGGAVGFGVSSTETFDFVPSIALEYVSRRTTVALSLLGSDFSFSDSQSYGVMTIAAGFVFRKTVTIYPLIHVPIGLDGAKADFGAGVAFNFGRRR